MSALVQSKVRFERVRANMDRASLCLTADDLVGVESLCTAALADLELCWLTFKHDWLSLDCLVAMLAVTRAWCERKELDPVVGVDQLLQRALELRMRWLEGQDE